MHRPPVRFCPLGVISAALVVNDHAGTSDRVLLHSHTLISTRDRLIFALGMTMKDEALQLVENRTLNDFIVWKAGYSLKLWKWRRDWFMWRCCGSGSGGFRSSYVRGFVHGR